MRCYLLKDPVSSSMSPLLCFPSLPLCYWLNGTASLLYGSRAANASDLGDMVILDVLVSVALPGRSGEYVSAGDGPVFESGVTVTAFIKKISMAPAQE